MNPYQLFRPLLFKQDAEKAHHLTLELLQKAYRLGLTAALAKPVAADPVSLWGLQFPNRVGLAAGLDKNGDYIDALAALGFGFIEIGTVTPRPQPGNPKPRLFRLPAAQAVINRFGFNNKGVDYLLERVKHAKYRGILGINIGKNFDTPIEKAVDDYLIGLRKVYSFASYITVNVSSPNTKNLRQLQQAGEMGGLLSALKSEQHNLKQKHAREVPVLIKIAPDLSEEEVQTMAQLFLEHGVDGVIATNTTIDKQAVASLPHGSEQGGLSGAPLTHKSTQVIRWLAQSLQGRVPIIGVGGIMCGADAVDKINAGASLVQVYSGLVYRGPNLVREAASALKRAKA